jgi:MFS family permease
MRTARPPLLTRLEARAVDAVGDRRQVHVVLVLAAVLALEASDKGAVSATAANLEDAFSVGKTEIGLLLTVSQLVGATATLGFGVLVDRVRRTRLLALATGLWAVAMIAGSIAPTYWWLFASRIFLGGVTATAFPAVASLLGDAFPTGDRARIFSYVLAGELVGTGFGIVAAGILASVWSWRVAFTALALPAVAVGWSVHRLGEPRRREAGTGAPEERHDATPVELARRQGVRPDAGHVLDRPHAAIGLWRAIRYVLGVRTNVILIASSALGYYLFAGVRAFGVQYVTEHYRVSQGLASALVLLLGVGAIGGVLLGGRVTDGLLRRGRLDARIVVPAVGFLATVVVLAPALVTTSLALAVPLLITAGFFQALANPPLDAARLDVIPPRLWGRAEATRSVARTTLEAIAPLAFGLMADHLFSGGIRALELTFLVMLVPLALAGGILLLARRSYPTDVVTADESARVA